MHRASSGGREEDIMLWTIIGILIALWLMGWIAEVGGGLIHLLLVVALVVLLVNIFTSRRAL